MPPSIAGQGRTPVAIYPTLKEVLQGPPIPKRQNPAGLFQNNLGRAGVPIMDRVLIDINIRDLANEPSDLDPDTVDWRKPRTPKLFANWSL